MVSQSTCRALVLCCTGLASCSKATPRSSTPQNHATIASSSSVASVPGPSSFDLHPERQAPTAAIAELIVQANEREEGGDLRGAIEKRKAVLEIDPGEVVSMNVIAGLHGKLGEFEEELRWTAEALARNPRYVEALINRGNALGSLTRLDEADAAFSAALALDPRCREAHYGRGVTAELGGRDALAVQRYERAVALDKDYEDGWFNLAAARARLGDLDHGVQAVKEVLRINPDSEDAKKMLADMMIEIAHRETPGGKTE